MGCAGSPCGCRLPDSFGCSLLLWVWVNGLVRVWRRTAPGEGRAPCAPGRACAACQGRAWDRPGFGRGGQGPCPGRKRQEARLCLAGGACGGTMACHDAGRCDNPVAAPQARHRRGGAYAGGKAVSSARPARGKHGFGLRPGQGAMTQGRRPDAAGPDNRKTSICWKLIRMAPAAVSNRQRPRKNASPTRQRCGGM